MINLVTFDYRISTPACSIFLIFYQLPFIADVKSTHQSIVFSEVPTSEKVTRIIVEVLTLQILLTFLIGIFI